MRIQLLIISLSCFTILHAQYDFTGNGDTNSWSDNENWKKGAQDPATDFPDDGAEATVPEISGLLSAELSKDISLSNLYLSPNQQFSLNLDGNALNVTAQLREFGATSIIRDGTLNVTDLDVGDLRIVNTTFNLEGGTVYGSGLQLWSGTTLNLTGRLELTGQGLATGDSDATFHNNGGSLLNETSDGTLTLGLPYQQTAGSITFTNGTLALTSTAQATGGSVTAEGAATAIRFQGPTTLTQTSLTANQGATISFASSLSSSKLTTSGTESGTVAIEASNGETFAVSEFLGSSEVPITLNSGIQSSDTKATNTGSFIWAGGTVHNFDNNGTLQIESSGASASPRALTGLLTNNGTLRLDGAITLHPVSVLQNEEGSLLLTGSGSLAPASGALEQTGFANLGTLETFNAKSTATFSTRIINRGIIKIGQGSLSFTGPSELEGTIALQPQDFSETYAASLSVGGDNDVSHTLKALNFTTSAPAGENGSAHALFGRGSYTLSGPISSSADAPSDRARVHFQRGTWIADAGGALNFSENLPLTLGSESVGPTFRNDKPLSNSGYIDLVRATITGTEPFANSGTLTSQRLELGNNDTSGTLQNQGELTLAGGSSPLLSITPGSLLSNTGENATLTLSDNATIQSPLEASEPTFINAGTLATAAPSRGKTIAAPFRQKGNSEAAIHAASGNGNLTFQRPAEIEEGSLHSGALVTFSDSVDWGKSATPSIAFEDEGAVVFSANGKAFTLLDNLIGSGPGEFRLSQGTLAPQSAATKDLNFSGLSKLHVNGGTLGVSDASLRNFGNIEQTSGTLLGDLLNAGDYTLTEGSFDEVIFTNLKSFAWKGGSISGLLDNTNDFSSDTPQPEVSITGTGTLLTDATFINNGKVAHFGATRLQDNALLYLAAGSYEITDSGNIAKESNAISNTLIQIESTASLVSTREEASNPTASITIDSFLLNGGTVATKRTFANLAITTSELGLNGGTLELSDFSQLNITSTNASNLTLDSITVGDASKLTLQDDASSPLTLRSKNTNLRGTLKANLIQTGPYDSFDPNSPLQSSHVEGDLTQEIGDDIKTVVRADSQSATTLQVDGTASLAGPLIVVIDEDYEGSQIPLLTAGNTIGSWDPSPLIVSPIPGLSGTISYPDSQNAILSIERDPQAGQPSSNYRHYVYTHFSPEQRADPAMWGPTADPDNDGVTNLQSFAQGDNPTDGIPPPPLLSKFILASECESCEDCLPDCPDRELYARCELNVSPNLQGVEFKLIEQNDLANLADDQALPTTLWTPQEPPSPTSIFIQAPANFENSTKEFYKVELSLAEGETVL